MMDVFDQAAGATVPPDVFDQAASKTRSAPSAWDDVKTSVRQGARDLVGIGENVANQATQLGAMTVTAIPNIIGSAGAELTDAVVNQRRPTFQGVSDRFHDNLGVQIYQPVTEEGKHQVAATADVLTAIPQAVDAFDQAAGDPFKRNFPNAYAATQVAGEFAPFVILGKGVHDAKAPLPDVKVRNAEAPPVAGEITARGSLERASRPADIFDEAAGIQKPPTTPVPAVKAPATMEPAPVATEAPRPTHDNLAAGIPAVDSLSLQNIAPEVKPVVKGTAAEILAMEKQGATEGKVIHIDGDTAYVLDPNAVQVIYGGTMPEAIRQAKTDLRAGGDAESALLGYPKREGLAADQTIDVAVTKTGEVVTDLQQMKVEKEAGNIAWAAEGKPADLTAKAQEVADAIKRDTLPVADVFDQAAQSLDTTSMKNAVVDAERVASDLPPIETPAAVKTIKTSLDEGQRLIESGEFGLSTVESLAKAPRTISDSENMALLYMKQRNRNAHDTVTERLIEARRTGDSATVEALKAERDAVEMERMSIDAAGKAVGTEWGRAGRARQEMMAEDYSLSRNIQRARAESPTGDITEAHRREIESLTNRLETVLKEAGTKDEQIANLQAEMALRTIQREEVTARRKGERAVKRETLDLEFEELRKELNAIINPDKLNSGLDPAVVPVLVKMARNRVRKGMTKAADVVDDIHSSIEGVLEKREIRDAISGYGKQINPKQDAVSRNLREVKAQLRLVSALEDVQAGKPPLRSGLQRDQVSAEVRELQRQVRDAMGKSGELGKAAKSPEEQWKVSLDAVKKRLGKAIEDLTKQISTGEKPPERRSIEYDAEAKALKATRDGLKLELDRMETNTQVPDRQRVQQAVQAVKKSITEYSRRIAESDINPAKRGSRVPETPELKELRAQRDRLEETFREMVEAANPRRSAEEIALQSYKTRLATRIAELEQSLVTGDFGTKPKKPITLDAEARRLKAKEEDLKRQIDAVVNPMTAGKKFRAVSVEAWKAGLLSGPKTHIVNVASNALTIGLKPIETLIASGAETVRSKLAGAPREVFPGEAMADVVGLRAGVDEGFRRAARGWAEALPLEEAVKHNESQQMFAIPGRTGKIVRIPFRALTAADGFFKAIAESSEVYRQAYKQAAMEGLKGEPLKARMAEIIQDPGAKIIDRATREADYRTFNSEFGPFGRWVASSRRIPYVGFLADILMPFIRTPINIAKYGMERTPLNFGRLLHKAFKGQMKGAELSEEMAKPIMGTMIAAAITNGVISGNITSGGPKDKASREALVRTGWQPYSFKIGDKYFAYNRLEPLGMIAGTAADFADLAFGNESNVKTAADAANAVALSIAKNWTSKTFMQSLSAALDATSDPKRYGGQFLNNYAGSLVPSVVNSVTTAVDEDRRDVRDAGSAMMARIPGASEQLEIKRDLWGRQLKKGGLTWVDRTFSPVSISQESTDRVDSEILRLGLSPGMPQRKIQGNELTEEQYSRYVEETGQRSYVVVRRIVSSGSSDESKRRQIQNTISTQRELVGNKLLREWGMEPVKKAAR